MAREPVNKDAWGGPAPPIAATSPVAVYHQHNLPLNLIALILSYIDDLSDLSRITRTSRLLYYMTLPRLYERVTLRSYNEVRYKDNGRPEGYGSGSPFSMGLNGLVTMKAAQYVRSWRLVGEWRESDVDDFSKGRVPDNSMMLNIAVRAAMDRMDRLQEFAWELNTKPLQTIYRGLLSCPTLRSLTLKFPNTRIPRPTVLIPPLPNLREFKALEIDPLCYPDDISLLLVQCKNLEALHLHWSPRMRDAGEESTNLSAYFGRCMASGKLLHLKRFSMVNLFTRATNIDLDALIDVDALEEMTFINCNTQDAMTVFVDDTWRMFEPQKIPKRLKVMRGDVLDMKQVGVMMKRPGLERLYLVNAKRRPKATPNGATPGAANNAFVADLTTSPSVTSPDASVSRECATIAGDYLAAITHGIGAGLKHLLLSDQWRLGGDLLVQLLRACPQLEQLGLALAEKNSENMGRLPTYLPKLWALRILIRSNAQDLELISSISGDLHEHVIAFETRRGEWDNVRWLGIGDMVFECGGVRDVSAAGTLRGARQGLADPTVGEDSEVRRIVKKVDRSAVQNVEIWSMDSMDI